MAEWEKEDAVSIIGVGMGNPQGLTVEAQAAIQEAGLLIGAGRMLAPYRQEKKCAVSYQPEEIVGIIEENRGRQKSIAVLMSGDSGFYSGARALLAAFYNHWGKERTKRRVTVLPGISSLSYFCAKIGKSWENVKLVNLHGACENLWQAVLTHEKVFAVTGGDAGEQLARLAGQGLGDVRCYVGENLSYPKEPEEASCDEGALYERITEGTVGSLAHRDYAPLTVLYLENPEPAAAPLWGLPDQSFVRGKVPMTKAEVRAVVMSRLRIRERDVVYDIGAGTGSVSVEAALTAYRGCVYAVETNPQAVELCKLNKERFCLSNLEIVEGLAPDALQELPAPDVVFIGGSKGRLEEILEAVYCKNPHLRLVINTVTVENTAKALELLESGRFTELEAVQIQAARIEKAGAGHLLKAQNPITVFSAKGLGQPERRAWGKGGLLVASTGSGGGKTLFTCGLLRLLMERGLRPAAFKCGPDYIDPSFHRRVTGTPGYNLDPFFTGEDVLRQLYEEHGKTHDISVVEGVMGYYDGLGFADEASTYSVAKALGVPVLLLVDCKGMGHSVLAAVEGFVKHRQPSGIAGVVFNRMPPSLYPEAAQAVRELGLLPLGYLPEHPKLRLESRHLGLVTAEEIENFAEKVDDIAALLSETVDVEGLLRLAGQRDKPLLEQTGKERHRPEERLRIAVARDEAFCFLYEDNLNFLRERDAEILFFSPLHDQKMPPDCDAVYLSGGYPELYAKQLEENISMKKDIRKKILSGTPCIAECGGFLYLHQRLEAAGENGKAEKGAFREMTGVLLAQAVNKRRKGRFGYIEVTLKHDCLLGKEGEIFRAHEFHYWETDMEQADLAVRKPGNGSAWEEGFCTDTLYAGFPHLYFYGSPGVGENFLTAAAKYRAQRR
ncbi:MAG: cobyrinate a,c-diamide synthase [Clostridiales bacterium]|nr:cobyrinate a,c-diamide synthase [Clostridiales bacterium]